jgi:hypothetical protein
MPTNQLLHHNLLLSPLQGLDSEWNLLVNLFLRLHLAEYQGPHAFSIVIEKS